MSGLPLLPGWAFPFISRCQGFLPHCHTYCCHTVSGLPPRLECALPFVRKCQGSLHHSAVLILLSYDIRAPITAWTCSSFVSQSCQSSLHHPAVLFLLSVDIRASTATGLCFSFVTVTMSGLPSPLGCTFPLAVLSQCQGFLQHGTVLFLCQCRNVRASFATGLCFCFVSNIRAFSATALWSSFYQCYGTFHHLALLFLFDSIEKI